MLYINEENDYRASNQSDSSERMLHIQRSSACASAPTLGFVFAKQLYDHTESRVQGSRVVPSRIWILDDHRDGVVASQFCSDFNAPLALEFIENEKRNRNAQYYYYACMAQHKSATHPVLSQRSELKVMRCS